MRAAAPAWIVAGALALACGRADDAPDPAARSAAIDDDARPDARLADLPLDAELARRLADLADRIEAEPRASAALLRAAGLTVDGYVDRLYAVTLDPRLSAVYRGARTTRPPDVASMAHVLDDEDD